MNRKVFTLAIALSAIILSTITYRQVSQPVEFSPELIAKFNAWTSQQQKLYSSPSEMKLRLSVFKSNLEKIESINASNLGWKAGLNQFSDLSKKEFAAQYLMKNTSTNMLRNVKGKFMTNDSIQAPSSYDLREQVGSNIPVVKYQESCGSCYAFSASTAIEYSLALSKKPDHKYTGQIAPQEFVDCSGVSHHFIWDKLINFLGSQ